MLTGRHQPGVPASKRLGSTSASNVLVYMSGHGGDGFLKFQDFEEVSSPDLADAFEEMHGKQRYNEILFIVDTCQASTLGEDVRVPNVLAVGSSLRGQNSYGHHTDHEVRDGWWCCLVLLLLLLLHRSLSMLHARCRLESR